MRTTKFLITAALAAIGLTPPTVLTSAPAAHAASAPLQTVPVLQNWTAGSGSFTWNETSRVVVDPAYADQLSRDARTFAADLSALKGRNVAVATGTANPGDIRLTLGGSQPAEGYTMTVGDRITVQGSTANGEFWGTRTALQMLRQASTIPAGTAKDGPVKSERGLMVDAAPKFLPVEWIKNEIRDMSYLKMNHLTLGFGARLASNTHPEIKPASPGQYSRQDIKDIIAVADAYHVKVVPEIDMPGHMDDILAAELKAGHDYYLKDGAGKNVGANIDLSNPDARQLISDLLHEYPPLFTNSPYWHLGADEVTDYSPYPKLLAYARATYGPNAIAQDALYGFVNWADSIVRAGGKTMRMWNDELSGDGTVTVKSDIIVEYWSTAGLSPQQLVNGGHTIANESQDPTYYTPGAYTPNTTWMYQGWKPDLFQGGQTISDAAKNLGSQIHVWYDNPNSETVDQTAAGIKYPLRVLAQMTWNGNNTTTYADFDLIMDAVGRDPLWPTAAPGGQIVGANSGRCVDIPAANPTDGHQLQLYDCNGTNAQQWTHKPDGTLQALGKCMDVRAAGTADGTPVQTYTCNGTNAQKWTWDPSAKTYKALGKCLDARANGTPNGTLLQLYTCNGTSAQQWSTP